jgi:hypothetical protein
MLPPEPPFRRYADTHDSIGCADLTTPEEEARSHNAQARALGTAPAMTNQDIAVELSHRRHHRWNPHHQRRA